MKINITPFRSLPPLPPSQNLRPRDKISASDQALIAEYLSKKGATKVPEQAPGVWDAGVKYKNFGAFRKC